MSDQGAGPRKNAKAPLALVVPSAGPPSARSSDPRIQPSGLPSSASGADPGAVLAAAAAALARGTSGAMATVLERHGSAPGTPGQKLFLSADGTWLGTVGGGAVEHAVLESLAALAATASGAGHGSATKYQHEVRTFKLGAELGMCCGGRLVVLLEPLVGLVPSLIVGAGHVATAVAPLLAKVGFAVTVVDARDGWAEDGRIPGVRCVSGDYDEAGRELPAETSACLVMTHDHRLDQDAIEWGLRQGFAFVGGIGSRAKAERTRQRLEAKGFSEADRARVRMPLGVAIGARTPDEIAVSVVAELVAWRRGTPG